MKFGGRLIHGQGQLQWAVLLAIAVALPTVSLLWFMGRVVANERLVVRQKLAALYQDKLADATAKTQSLCASRLASLDTAPPPGNPYALFNRLVLDQDYDGLVIWGADASVAYPRSADLTDSEAPSDLVLNDARQQEFARAEYARAAELYERFSTDADPHIALAALAGESRCLSKLGRTEAAIEQCRKAAFAAELPSADPALRLAVENARLLLLSLLQHSPKSPEHSATLQRTVAALSEDLYNADGDSALLAPNQNIFIAQKVLAVMRQESAREPSRPGSPSAPGDGGGSVDRASGPIRGDAAETARRVRRLEKLAAAEELSVAAAETLRPFGGPFDVVAKIDLGQRHLYGVRHRAPSFTCLLLFSEPAIASALSGYRDAFTGSEAAYRILDDSDGFVAGKPKPEGKPFTTAALPAAFPGWKVELYFEGGDVFQKAARRQIAIYVWTGGLVIAMILLAGAFATRAVGRQIRLNTMKNDFIATVSHELKTPLASMRVLVDTLLEGNFRNEDQARDYLRLTAKENERLTRMIDNFLTFSRMERNKMAFASSPVRPAAVAGDAVESVKTKLAANHCHLDVEIAEPLPEMLGDHDAIVTVLVNLLDNACKYTTENKKVALRVFAQGDFVCFAVADNGIGLARRHLRRIFDRFYQVDSSLARKAEGCGLGLSIVKFIVDAHKGKIVIESKPGSGSTFTVRLPVSRSAGD